MDNILRPETIRWTVMLSAGLHGLLFAALALQISKTEIVPIGVEVQYLGENKGSPAVVAPRVKAQPAKRIRASQEKGDVTLKAKEPAPASAQAVAQAEQGLAGARDGALVTAIERYKYELRLFLESRKIYPESAKRLRQTGTVIVEFKVSPLGELSQISVTQASNSEALNRAALELVKRANSFKPFPKEVRVSELQLRLPIEYVL